MEEPEGRDSADLLTSGLDNTVSHIISQQPYLPAQDQREIKTIKVTAWNGSRF